MSVMHKSSTSNPSRTVKGSVRQYPKFTALWNDNENIDMENPVIFNCIFFKTAVK